MNSFMSVSFIIVFSLVTIINVRIAIVMTRDKRDAEPLHMVVQREHSIGEFRQVLMERRFSIAPYLLGRIENLLGRVESACEE